MPTPTVRLAPSTALAAAAAERLLAHPGDEAIVASGGVAHAIAAEVLRRVPRGVATLRMRTLETLATAILNDRGEFPRVASDDERRLAMRVAVRSIDDPMMESRGIASMLERSYRDVRDSGVTLQQFDARTRAARGLRDAARTRTILRAWTEYERIIAGLGAIDPAELLDRAARAIANGAAVAPQLVAGFYDMTGVQFRILDALAKVNKLTTVLVPARRTPDYRFADRFLAAVGAEETIVDDAPRDPAISVTRYDTKLSELAAVTHAVEALIAEGADPRTIGIVARTLDAYDARLLGLAEDIPARAHRIGRGLITLLQLRERGYMRGDVIELLRDGFTPQRAVKIDDVDVATRRARIAGGAVHELGPVPRKPFIDDYLAVVAELEQLTEPLTGMPRGVEWAEAITSLCSRFRLDGDRDVAAAEELDRIAAVFRRAGMLRFDATAVIDLIEQHALETKATNRVWAGDLLKFRGRSFEHLFVVRMQDELFPMRRVDDPLVPDADRRQAGVREIGNGRDEEQFLFQLLLDGATHVHFSFAGTDGFGKVLRPSQLLRPPTTSSTSEYLGVPRSTSEERRDSLHAEELRKLQLLARSGTNGVFDGYLSDPALRERFRRALESVSPTGLEDFGECPQKFLFKHILGVRDFDDPERELQIHHREKGTLDHRILERFYRGLREADVVRAKGAAPRLPDDLASALDAIVDEEFDRIESEAPPFNRQMRDIERRATKRNLHDFVAADLADLLQRGLAPKHFEYTFGPKYEARADHAQPFTIAAGDAQIRVEGRIDRIDGDGERLRIIDYKSGQALRHKDLDRKIDRGVRLQLALYAMAIAEFFGAAPEAVEGAIKPLILGEVKATKFEFKLAEKGARLRETLNLFASAILEGVFPAFPNDNDDVNSCKYCPVAHSCRTRHDAEERYAVLGWREARTLLEGPQ